MLNRFGGSTPMAGEAEVKYLDGDFRVVFTGCLGCVTASVTTRSVTTRTVCTGTAPFVSPPFISAAADAAADPSRTSAATTRGAFERARGRLLGGDSGGAGERRASPGSWTRDGCQTLGRRALL